MSNYLPEFMMILSITLVAIIIPGPNFVVVTRNSLIYRRKAGILSAIGVGTAVWIHIGYSLLGIEILHDRDSIFWMIIKYAGVGYLMYIGFQSVLSKKRDTQSANGLIELKKISSFKAFQIGFLNNMLNPQASFFFLSLFSQFVSEDTPFFVQICYGGTASLISIVWFSLVAFFITWNNKSKSNNVLYIIEKTMGSILIGLSLNILLT